jgi:hypothetical protein
LTVIELSQQHKAAPKPLRQALTGLSNVCNISSTPRDGLTVLLTGRI